MKALVIVLVVVALLLLLGLAMGRRQPRPPGCRSPARPDAGTQR